MRFARPIAAALLIGSASLVSTAPATSAPLMNQPNFAASVPSATETVQFRRGGFRGGYRGGYGYRGGGYGYRRGYGGGGALLGGLAAGALIGGAIAASQAPAYAAGPAYVGGGSSYCAQRYRSYDPASGTYLNNDGNRYPCP